MKVLKNISLLVIGILLFSCEVDYLDNPNEPIVPTSGGLMTRVQKQFMNDTRDEWMSGRMSLLWVQYWNQVNYTEEDRYQYRETVNKAGWNDIYKNAQDLKDIIAINTDDATKGDANVIAPNENQIAAARIMLAYVFQLATDIWGDIPYYSYGNDDPDFEALQLKDGGSITPKYASQEKIYKDLLKELDEAQAMIIEGKNMIGADLFYDGDASMWKKFANSLRLRIANRIKDKDATLANQHIADALAEGVYTSNDDNAGVKFENSALNGAPMYRAFVVSARRDFAPSYSFVQLLKGNDIHVYSNPFAGLEDPRLPIYVDPNGDGEYLGVPVAESNASVRTFKWESKPGAEVLSSTYKELYMEYSEICFIQSELNGWDQTWYEYGVEASMQKWGVPQADIDAFIATLPAATEETVMTQKYIALYMNAYEAWSELRRTGYPQTLIKSGDTYDYTFMADGEEQTLTYFYNTIVDLPEGPSRVKYLLNEDNINKENKDAAVAAMGGDEMDTKMWWQP
ncbi:SusD/RagB family nutrient-binding outer membrane lipoprotein [Carboxylicivirga sp. A043]|uniref:SusD/RagB family nutrient-binding outer membrane lipoprotein n=1 Tax=Carboxylicivirga litoralis TaxID=2816963 RepID=UPI0021CB0ED4|nr:SusD/RagB family nutrient-binding outer membrane lipoprotein [Carboxylicivirga sp. A043]MCU4156860.1 SusD/RagB family nutrient-binding outer membrane lipoprotein [Carboxylicivirga sp. A043]